MLRVLLIALLVGFVAWQWRLWRNAQRAKRQPAPPPTASAPEAMLRCCYCGVHIPATLAQRDRNGVHCGAHQP